MKTNLLLRTSQTVLILLLALTTINAQDYNHYQNTPRPSSKVIIEYNVHAQGLGDMGWETQPHMAGTTGQNRQLEAFAIRHANGSGDEITIRYKAYCQDIGWQGWTLMSEWAGTKGQKRRLEAFKIEVVDKTSEYSIYYRGYLHATGWTDWMKDGEMCGTTQEQRAVEAMEIMVVDR